MKILKRNIPGNHDVISERITQIGSTMRISSFVLDIKGDRLVSYLENGKEALYIVLGDILMLEIIESEDGKMGKLSKISKASKEYKEEVLAYIDINKQIKFEWEKSRNKNIEEKIKNVIDFYEKKRNKVIPSYIYYSA